MCAQTRSVVSKRIRVTKSWVGAGEGSGVGCGEGFGVPASQDTVSDTTGASFETQGSRPSRWDE
jgi:hypothetical protein